MADFETAAFIIDGYLADLRQALIDEFEPAELDLVLASLREAFVIGAFLAVRTPAAITDLCRDAGYTLPKVKRAHSDRA